jgi:PadR family transcriptional regulator, regulatory protein PadR
VEERKPSSSPDSAEKWEIQLRKGSLELAILASLWEGSLYGLEILRHLESSSDLVDAEWVESDSGHPRKYYRLTAAGRQRALEMARVWEQFSGSMTNLLAPLKRESPLKKESPLKPESQNRKEKP